MAKLSVESRSLQEISEETRHAATLSVLVSDAAVEELVRRMLDEDIESVTEHIIGHYRMATEQQRVRRETRGIVAARIHDLRDKQRRERQRLLIRGEDSGQLDELILELSEMDLDDGWEAAEDKFATANLDLAKARLSTEIVSVDGFRDHSWHAVLRRMATAVRRAPRLLMISDGAKSPSYTRGLSKPTEAIFVYALELRPATLKHYLELATTELNQAKSNMAIAASRGRSQSPKRVGKKQGNPSRNEARDEWVYNRLMAHPFETYEKIATELEKIAGKNKWETLDATSIYNTAVRYWERNRHVVKTLRHPRTRRRR